MNNQDDKLDIKILLDYYNIELEYSKNLHVKQVIDRVNDIGELPILTIAGDVLNSTSTAKQSVGTAVEILNRMNVISKQVKEDIKIIKNIRALTDSLVKPIDEVTDLLNDKNRQMVHDIVEKINRMLKTLTDDEINQVLTKGNCCCRQCRKVFISGK